MLSSRKSLSQMQTVAVIALVVATIGAYYYAILSAPVPTPFSMEVIPEHTEVAVAGRRCMFLVVVADEGEGNGASASFHWLSALG